MDLRRLEVFLKVAELGSFSRAADALFLTQPTVSEHVRALEDELGVQLLDRLGRGTTPTKAGTLLLGYARRLLTLSREARQAIEQFQGRMSGELVLGGSTIPGEYVLPALIGGFRVKYPDVSISLRIGPSRQVQDWVEQGHVEIGVVGAAPTSRALETRRLMADDLVLIVPPEHPLVARKAVTLEDVRREPLIVRERGSGSRETLEDGLKEAGLDLGAFHVVGEIASTQAVKQAVRAGLGVSFVSQRAVEDECRARLLACVKVRNLNVSRAFHLITHKDRSRSPLAQAFLAFVESQPVERPS
ncbi:MAG TPA: selenium metabolism-associated LysR family transcriptional regulator [Candidatus Binatia bacterium]|nr:selenium metabolism-associated LysR family transcriptional regulator [Candidatus Binatia bacterium]